MAVYRCAAVGGTFDVVHRGHKALLSESFRLADRVIIGLTSDKFASSLGKNLEHPYQERLKTLHDFLRERFPDRIYEIWELDDYFGPAISLEDVDAIVVSEETAGRVEIANRERARKGLAPLKAEIVKIVVAEDGEPISATRIRNKEIDVEGHLIS